jgi:hypothetical protein
MDHNPETAPKHPETGPKRTEMGPKRTKRVVPSTPSTGTPSTSGRRSAVSTPHQQLTRTVETQTAVSMLTEEGASPHDLLATPDPSPWTPWGFTGESNYEGNPTVLEHFGLTWPDPPTQEETTREPWSLQAVRFD